MAEQLDDVSIGALDRVRRRADSREPVPAQDAPLMEAMQEMLGVDELLRRQPVLLSVDQGPVRTKRVLDDLLVREAAGDRDDAQPGVRT